MDMEIDDEQRTLKEEDLLPLIIQQLSAFGYTQLASVVGEQTNTPVDLPSNRLSELIALGLIKEQEPEDGEEDLKPTFESEEGVEDEEKAKNCLCIDGETVSERKEVPEYRHLYTTAHKGACSTAIFSPDGRYIATGSADTSLKVIDVSKCKKLNERTGEPLEKPVIRTLYDHAGPVNEVSFHPNGLVLASCSEDQTIKLFDISKPGIKRSFRYLQDTYNVRSINFHPSGDYILTGTDHNAVRIFDVKTFQCFTASADTDNTHEGAITQVRYANTGNVFVTSSTDGDIRIWDAISGRCVRHIAKGHEGASVSSVRISKTGKYLLSSGKDSVIRLWDVGSGSMISKYEGASQLTASGQATFSWNENFVISSDDMDNSVLFWDARTCELLKRFKGPNTAIRFIATSPTDPGYITCSDDFRARYWNVLDELDDKGR